MEEKNVIGQKIPKLLNIRIKINYTDRKNLRLTEKIDWNRYLYIWDGKGETWNKIGGITRLKIEE